MMSETNRNRLTVIAAASAWLVTLLNVLELAVEGSSVINWVSTVVFFVVAVHFSLLAVKMSQKRA